jgi:putative hemolysin
MSVSLEILVLFILIVINGLLAMTEIAVVAARKTRLQQQAEKGDAKSRMALELSKKPTDFLATIQIGITLIGILAGAFSGATVANYLSVWIGKQPILAPYAGALSLGIVVIVITYFSLVIGELVPKRLGLTNPERVAVSMAGLMRLMIVLARPLVRLLSSSTDLVLRILGVRPSEDPPITEEEIKILLEQGTQAGVFEITEQDMVSSVFRLADQRVGSLMTQRLEVVWLDVDDPIDVNRQKVIGSIFSRLPVAKGDLDKLQGVVQAKTLLARSLSGEPFDINCSLEEPLFVPESMPAFSVVELFRESRLHMAMVVDEFGSIQGLVTLNDILEAIIGEMPHPGEIHEPEIVLRADGSYLLDGLLPVEEFVELFRTYDLPNLEKGYYQTLNGFVMDFLGRIPTAGDLFEWKGIRFEVMDMDGKRVDKILVVPLRKEQDEFVD